MPSDHVSNATTSNNASKNELNEENKKSVTIETEATITKKSLTNTIYHEKQSRQLCALHALNNLFQDPRAFSKNDLDLIANSLSPNNYIIFNPHKSLLGFGNYDVNVILVALQKKNYEAVWFNKQKDPKHLKLKVIFGFILNIPNNCDFWKNAVTFFTSSRRHWIAVKKSGSVYYNLDSKLKEPLSIGDEENLYHFLKENIEEKNAEVFVVVTKDIAQQQNNWYNSPPSPSSKSTN